MYRFLQGAPPSVIIEFPIGDYNPTYMFWSIYHWHSLINGYSGYQPRDVSDTMAMMPTFPDDDSVARLQELHARYILVHQAFYLPKDYASLMFEIAQRPELSSVGRYRDWVGGDTQIFELRTISPSRTSARAVRSPLRP